MRRLVSLATLAAVAHGVHARAPAAMSEADMQRMMQGMQAMQACMAGVDMSAMERLGAEGKQLEAEVDALCVAGQRDAAQEKAMAFGLRIANDPVMRTMRACGEKMQGMLPPIPYADVTGEDGARHVCDM